MTNVCPYHCIYTPFGYKSYDERTDNLRHSHSSLAYLASLKNVCDFFSAVVRQSCGFARLSHDGLMAAVQTPLLSFPTVQLQVPYDPRDRRTSIVLLPCNVYDLIGPVWTFAKLSAICLRHSAPAKSYIKTNAGLV